MNYEEFVNMFSKMNGKGLISLEEHNAMEQITQFRQRNPAQYEQYRARMRKDRKGQ